jgi:PIN domain nuclease of toxin-antitoxin system
MVLDTHAVVWYLLEPSRMSDRSLTLVRQAIGEGNAVFVSAISILELVYLIEKGRMGEQALTRLLEGLSIPNAGLVCVPFDCRIALAARQIPRDQVPDMPDRIIAATALHLGVPVITRDRRIREAGVPTIW